MWLACGSLLLEFGTSLVMILVNHAFYEPGRRSRVTTSRKHATIKAFRVFSERLAAIIQTLHHFSKFNFELARDVRPVIPVNLLESAESLIGRY